MTGARKGELLELKWSYVFLGGQRPEIKFPDPKNEHPHIVPLSADAVEILRSLPRFEGCDFVFPDRSRTKPRVNINKVWTKIRTKAGLPNLWIHDLRRSVGSWLGAQGHSSKMIGTLLNHRSDITSRVYVQLGKLGVKRDLVNMQAELLRVAKDGASKENAKNS